MDVERTRRAGDGSGNSVDADCQRSTVKPNESLTGLPNMGMVSAMNWWGTQPRGFTLQIAEMPVVITDSGEWAIPHSTRVSHLGVFWLPSSQ